MSAASIFFWSNKVTDDVQPAFVINLFNHSIVYELAVHMMADKLRFAW